MMRYCQCYQIAHLKYLANLLIASLHSTDYSKKTEMCINLSVCFLYKEV